MIRNLTISEFEAMVTQRVLCDRLVNRITNTLRDRFSYDELLSQGVFAANDVLKEIGINCEAWVRVRGRRAYMFHEPTRRIMAELGVVSDETVRGLRLRKRPRYILVGRRGYVRSPTIGDLVVASAKLGNIQRRHKPTVRKNRTIENRPRTLANNPNERRNYEKRNYQSKTQ